MTSRKSRSRGFWVALAGVLVAALMLSGGSGAAPLAPGDSFRIVSSTFTGNNSTFVVMNDGTTNLAVFQATFPAGTRIVSGSSSPSATTCAGGSSPNVGACLFLDQALWPPGSNRTLTFQLEAPAPAGKAIRLCATSQFGGTDVCKEVTPPAVAPCKCSRIDLDLPPGGRIGVVYSPTSIKAELKWTLVCKGGPGACAGEINVSLKKSPVFRGATVLRPRKDVSCRGKCRAKDDDFEQQVRSGALLFEISAKNSLKPRNRKGQTLVIRFRMYCAGSNKPRTNDLELVFDRKEGDLRAIRLNEFATK